MVVDIDTTNDSKQNISNNYSNRKRSFHRNRDGDSVLMVVAFTTTGFSPEPVDGKMKF